MIYALIISSIVYLVKSSSSTPSWPESRGQALHEIADSRASAPAANNQRSAGCGCCAAAAAARLQLLRGCSDRSYIYMRRSFLYIFAAIVLIYMGMRPVNPGRSPLLPQKCRLFDCRRAQPAGYPGFLSCPNQSDHQSIIIESILSYSRHTLNQSQPVPAANLPPTANGQPR